MEVVFQPDYAGLDKNIWLAMFVVLIAAIALTYLFVKKQAISHNYRSLGMLLLGFGVAISLAVAVFSYWSIQKIGPLSVAQDGLSSVYGDLTWQELKRVYVSLDQPQANFFQINPGPGTHYLVIEPIDGVNWIFSEINYEVMEIKELIDQKMAALKD